MNDVAFRVVITIGNAGQINHIGRVTMMQSISGPLIILTAYCPRVAMVPGTHAASLKSSDGLTIRVPDTPPAALNPMIILRRLAGNASRWVAEMEISRTWVMPSIWTFSMKPVQTLFEKYQVGAGWADPFAGENSPAEFANDIEGRGNQYQMDALEFLKSLPDSSMTGVLFDPPYSVEQCLRRYTPKQGGTAGRAEYWAKCKDEIARIVKPEGLVISFCWDSTGIGKKRGFEIIEIVLLCHGACHNDTVITVDRHATQQSMHLTAFGVGTAAVIPLQASLFADDQPATIGGR